MGLLTKLTLQNFRCYRRKTEILLNQGSYLIGANNAGKSAALYAIRFFFDDQIYTDESFLNRTELAGKGAGYNRALITLDFNLEALRSKALKKKLIRSYDKNLSITKEITITERTKNISFRYIIDKKPFEVNQLSNEVQKLINSVSLTYLHPQEGRDLLNIAQNKLRARLLANWGRHSSITQSLQQLQQNWDDLKQKAKNYLSTTLTKDLQILWPGSAVTIELPKSIKDIVEISDIAFQGHKTIPEIQLTSQGTGAQSTILYHTHFLLDSDRSLHQGEYHPIWLLEEPESFLHADLITKFSKELNSPAWLENIQMIISTHSPIILAGSKIEAEKINWVLIEGSAIKRSNKISDWDEESIKEIGTVMGDSNFYAYFILSSSEPQVFIEDEHARSIKAYKDKGIDVTGLKGTSEIVKYLEVLSNNPALVSNKVCFFVDGDKGRAALEQYLKKADKQTRGFNRYKIRDNVFVISLPDGCSIEDLFDEFDSYLEECMSFLFDTSTWRISADNIPANFSRAHAFLRGKGPPKDKGEARKLIKNLQEIKDNFWKKVDEKNWSISTSHSESLKKIIR